MSIAPRLRLLALAAVLSLGFTACGADETIDAGTSVEVPADQSEALPDEARGEEVTPESNEDVSEGFTPMIPRNDLVSLQAAAPDEVIADPDDDSRLLIHFVGAAEPCSGAAITVTENEAEIIVVLETGLDPNAAAMSCIAQSFDYEIAVSLDAPLGDRVITLG